MDEQSEPTTPHSSPRAKWGFALLMLAGVLIAGLTFWRMRQLESWKRNPTALRVAPRALAPRFKLADHNRHLVKFERFLGRQRVILVFFDPNLGALKDPRLAKILNCYDSIESEGIEVVAVSSATPYANAQAEKERGKTFPFPLLTDIDPQLPVNDPVHRLWGSYDEKARRTMTGVFLVARDGTVPIGPEGLPLPVTDELETLDKICRGEWPR